MRSAAFISALVLAWSALSALAAPASAPGAGPAAAAPDARGIEFFEKRVRPVLSEHCFGCHSGPKAAGRLELRSRAGILRGGELGPAIVPGDPERSLLITAVRYTGDPKMPPKGRIPESQARDLAEWVRMGAPWPGAAPAAAAAAPGAAPAKTARLWSFQPVREPALPAVKGTWARTPVDRFLLAALERAGLKPNGPADRRALLRRATFDLTGLPPTPEETEAFLADREPGAFERVVERLLASPRYGERWGRHWLDVARYSDSNGLDENELFANAHRYRDWVIRAFNEDRPYDRFVREQIAGDLLPAASEAEAHERLIATGFLVLGPKVLAERDKPKLAMDVVDEQLDTVGRAFMGLTLGCARCHDHKFDPVSARDYYAMAGIFKSTTTLFGNLQGNVAVSGWLERPLAKPDTVEAWKAHEAALKKLQDALKKEKDDAGKAPLMARIKEMEAKAPPEPPMAMAVQDGKIEDLRIHIRGSHRTLGAQVPRGFIQALAAGRQPALDASRSGRLELAEWITRPDHPLTARVMVNRVWQHHFGRGLVGTPDNFGAQGERPTHPELLDWLARRFVESGWSVKALHRLLMTSAAYRMSSDENPAALARDPENRLLWRAARRRLEAEAIRDAMLAANGKLDLAMGGTLVRGKGVVVSQDSKSTVEYLSPRRSVYLPVIRTLVYELFQVFDFVDPHTVTGRRETTTVAPQALYMLNSPFILEQSEQFARLLLGLKEADDERRAAAAYERALGRPPAPQEVSRALAFIEQYAAGLAESEKDPEKRRLEAWRAFCQAIYASSEFRYVD